MRERSDASRYVVEGEGATMRRFVLLTAVAGLAWPLAGCGVAPLQVVKVPVPIECNVGVPVRPAMPTEALGPGVDLDSSSASTTAEIELREGYEGGFGRQPSA